MLSAPCVIRLLARLQQEGRSKTHVWTRRRAQEGARLPRSARGGTVPSTSVPASEAELDRRGPTGPNKNAARPECLGGGWILWSARRGSNPRPSAWESEKRLRNNESC